MDVFTRFDLPAARDELLRRLAEGQVGILPTDTLYGLSGDATNPKVVRRIQRIKRRANPLSVIAPSLAWAAAAVAPRVRPRLPALAEKYAGPFTLLAPASSARVAAAGRSARIGLRFPAHWVSELCAELARPLVSTSVNLTRVAPMTSLETLDPRIARAVDFIAYEGELPGPPSTLVWLGPRLRLERRG